MSGTHYWHIYPEFGALWQVYPYRYYIPTSASWERIRRCILRYGVKFNRLNNHVEIMLGGER